MARLRLLDGATAPLSCRDHFNGGDPGPIVAALAQVPELLGPSLRFVGAALGPGAASLRHKEMAILRTSWLLECGYCTGAHTVESLDAGLTADEVGALRGRDPLDGAFADPAERVLVGWIDAMAAPGPVPDRTWEDARTHWSEHILVELAVTIGATMFLNRFATGFELPSSDAVVERLTAEGWA